MKITYLGHSAFIIQANEFKGLIDPFINGNDLCPISTNDLTGITHIFVTHGHGDHLGDTVEIAKKHNALVITNYEIGQFLANNGVKVHSMHIGGRMKFDFGTVKLTSALHGSGIDYNGQVFNGGNPCGFCFKINGINIYHAGDTGLSIEMKLLKDEKIDVALLPIGGNYTMDIDDAVKAVKFIEPKFVVPMHYNSFDVIKADPEEFKSKVKNSKVIIMKYMDEIEI